MVHTCFEASSRWTRPAVPLLGAFLAAWVGCSAPSAPPPADPLSVLVPAREAEIVQYLAADELEGRGNESRGVDEAANYIAGRFAEFGLTAGGDGGGYFQRFKITTDVKVVPKRNWVRYGAGVQYRSLRPEIEFMPLALSATNGRAEGAVVFAGYGITAPAAGYDDYAGLDVKGKVVIVMRYAPGVELEEGGAAAADAKPIPPLYQELRFKAMNARDHGAAALLVITGPRSRGARGDALLSLGSVQGANDCGIPVVHVIRRVAEDLLGAERLQAAQEQIDTTRVPHSFSADELTPIVRLQTALERQERDVANVVGILPGTNPALAELVVVGAHYDHLGHGGPGSRAPGATAIHPGADDNASGVAAMTAIADALSKGPKPARSVVFVAFAGEELGLLGSAYFAAHPPANSRIYAMLNFDMVGRLREQQLTVMGVDSAKEWRPLLTGAKSDGLKLTLGGVGYGPGDQTTFAARGVPVLSFFTGTYPDYHRPTDTADKVNYEGLAAVSRLGYRVALATANRTAPLAFVPVEPVAAPASEYGPFLGAVPDFSEAQGGLRLEGVRPGSPAERAGLQAGDIVTRFGDRAIRNFEDYATALRGQKPGAVVKINVQRKDVRKPVTVQATIGEQR